MPEQGPWGCDRAFEIAFYEENDRRKFVQRRLFLFAAIMTYALFGILDPLLGGDDSASLVRIRVVTLIVLSATWGVFATARDYRVREVCILTFGLICTVSILMMIVYARGPAADYYPFAIGVIQVFGGGLVVPQFRTMAINSLVSYIGFWGTVNLGETSTESLSSSAFLLTVTTVAVIIGSHTREAMERDQFRKERELAEARDEALRRGREAIIANNAKSHMMANVSHELRTPMNAIIGFSEVMKEEVFGAITPSKYREYVDDIHSSGRILLSNINDLLDMARIESGKMGWEDGVFAVADAMDIAAKSSMALLHERGIRIVWHDHSGGARLRGDFDRLCQAMINVLNNAGKFSPPGGTIAMTFDHTPRGWALGIADEGCGIPAEDLHRIREPFAQVGPDSYSAAKGGLGLGLAITGEIIRHLDGEIVIDSTVGRGTTVTFLLPAERIDTAPERRRA